MRLLVEAEQHCEKSIDKRMRNLNRKRVECDELWSFCLQKQKHVREDDPAEFGDQWIYVALDADSKLIRFLCWEA